MLCNYRWSSLHLSLFCCCKIILTHQSSFHGSVWCNFTQYRKSCGSSKRLSSFSQVNNSSHSIIHISGKLQRLLSVVIEFVSPCRLVRCANMCPSRRRQRRVWVQTSSPLSPCSCWCCWWCLPSTAHGSPATPTPAPVWFWPRTTMTGRSSTHTQPRCVPACWITTRSGVPSDS